MKLYGLVIYSLPIFILAGCGGGSSGSKTNKSSPVSIQASSTQLNPTPSSRSSSIVSSLMSSSEKSSVAASSLESNEESSIAASSVMSSITASSQESSIEIIVPSSSSSSSLESSSEASSSETSSSEASSSVTSSSEISSSSAISSESSSSSTSSASSSSSVGPSSIYHLRGTHNAWLEGDLLSPVEGSTTNFDACRKFSGSKEAAGVDGPRFKIDTNGGWGADTLPAGDFKVVAGWVKITFNSMTKMISAQSNLTENCGPAAPTAYHLRGTHNMWAEGDLFTAKAGSTTHFEICKNFAAGDANGGSRFKVDPNGAWGTDSFPAADEAATGWTKIEITTSPSNSIVSKITGLGENCTVAPIADDYRARTIYFMFVDRFYNGNTNNDGGKNPVATSASKDAGNLSQWKKYWGGDIAGMIAKLDYLEALGVTAIWVTPLVDNVDEGTEGIYHGYQSHDFYEVDEHLGDWAIVDELNVQMEKRGMKLVLDIALNHSNNALENEKGLLKKEGQMITDFAMGKGDWYHDKGSISCPPKPAACDWDIPEAYLNKMLFDLADFNHGLISNSVADEYLIGAAKKWMDHGVDAFRIDAIKHIEPSFVNRFTAAVKAKNIDTYVFGEWYGAGANDSASMSFLNENRGSELLDFNLRDNIEKAIADEQTMTALSAHIQSRPAAMKNKEDLQAIFLDNHDATRTSVYLQTSDVTTRGKGKGMVKAFAEARQNLGEALVMTLPGVPVIYYGSEQNSTNFIPQFDTDLKANVIGKDPYNRESMLSFNETTPAFTMISALANLRKESKAIQRGTYAERWVNNDVLVFQRQEGNDCAVVAINRGAQITITVPNLCLANAAYTSKVGTDVVNITSGTGTITLSQNEIVALH